MSNFSSDNSTISDQPPEGKDKIGSRSVGPVSVARPVGAKRVGECGQLVNGGRVRSLRELF